MVEKVRWGVLSTAKIGTKTVIPAMLGGQDTEVYAIASRDRKTARKAAEELGIPVAYGSYEELLADSRVEAVYNPLPNHLHVPWSVKALEAGKPVLCEKPLALTAEDARTVIAARDKAKLPAGEAFMVASHPQWKRAVAYAREGELGEVRAIQGFFSYYLDDPRNIRNIPEYGGGGLYDIGCYPIMTSRMILGEEPRRVMALADRDPQFGTDRLASVILDFPSCQASFVSATQLVPYQRMQVFGTKKRLEVQIPFNAPRGQECRLFLDSGDSLGRDPVEETTPPCDQYTLQGDDFSQAVRGKGTVPVPLENSLAMALIYEALFRSLKSGNWESP